MSQYRCSACDLAVIVIDGRIIRACPHAHAAIVAEMSGTVRGVGNVKLLAADITEQGDAGLRVG